MAKYFFGLHEDDKSFIDNEGFDLNDEEAARLEAQRLLGDLARENGVERMATASRDEGRTIKIVLAIIVASLSIAPALAQIAPESPAGKSDTATGGKPDDQKKPDMEGRESKKADPSLPSLPTKTDTPSGSPSSVR